MITMWFQEKFYSEYFGFVLVRIIPPMLHPHILKRLPPAFCNSSTGFPNLFDVAVPLTSLFISHGIP
jgi:hypothetical protein